MAIIIVTTLKNALEFCQAADPCSNFLLEKPIELTRTPPLLINASPLALRIDINVINVLFALKQDKVEIPNKLATLEFDDFNKFNYHELIHRWVK